MEPKKTIMIRLSESDKSLIEEAAYKCRVPVSAWVRSVIVEIASDQMGVSK